jgi:hypothetical protein
MQPLFSSKQRVQLSTPLLGLLNSSQVGDGSERARTYAGVCVRWIQCSAYGRTSSCLVSAANAAS